MTDSDVNFVNQYQYAFYPEKDFLNAVPEEFKKEEYQVLVLSCGPNEISNMNTTLNCRENIEEWKNRVGQSSVKMFQLAERCHQMKVSIPQECCNCEAPRYDDRIKAHLSEYANGVLDDMMKESGNVKIAVSRPKLFQMADEAKWTLFHSVSFFCYYLDSQKLLQIINATQCLNAVNRLMG